MSLPDSWADALFSKLVVKYGTAFMRQYEGVDLALVRGDWQVALAGFGGRQIAYALDNLPPDRPPNALQFKALCLRAPLEEFKRLPAPAPGDMPPDVREKLADLKAMGAGGLEWARRLRERERGGEKLTAFQREAWRRALREGEEPQDAQRLAELKAETQRKFDEHGRTA